MADADTAHDADEPGLVGEPFLQSGQCPSCAVGVVSHLKRARCTLCGNPVGLT